MLKSTRPLHRQYSNLLPGELPDGVHISWKDIFPVDAKHALFTSLFPERSYEWLREKCPNLKNVLLIADICPAPKKNIDRKVNFSAHSGNWMVLKGNRGSGLVHCSLMLFRTPTYLRFVCGGTNLEGQFEIDRDSLYVQDFPIVPRWNSSEKSNSKEQNRVRTQNKSNTFCEQLTNFLDYLPYANTKPDDRQVIDRHCVDILKNVDFTKATGRLVTCMPSNKNNNKGGWKELRKGIRELSDVELTNGRIDFATGHFGAIQTDFLSQMSQCFRNIKEPADNIKITTGAGNTTNNNNNGHCKCKQKNCNCDDSFNNSDNVTNLHSIGTVFMYHSSRKTILAPLTNSFAVMRTTAPATIARGTKDILLNNYFHDAIPKFRRENENSSVLVPILHGKCILAVHPNKDCATIFVGSQNFSKAAWGYGNQQPTNVEIGVVMCVKGIEEVKDLQARFPVELASDEVFNTPSEVRDYKMARGPTDGNNEHDPNKNPGLQGRWRARCNDLGSLDEWRLFLHHFWRMCCTCDDSGSGAVERVVRGDDEKGMGSETREERVKTMERLAREGVPYHCPGC